MALRKHTDSSVWPTMASNLEHGQNMQYWCHSVDLGKYSFRLYWVICTSSTRVHPCTQFDSSETGSASGNPICRLTVLNILRVHRDYVGYSRQWGEAVGAQQHLNVGWYCHRTIWNRPSWSHNFLGPVFYQHDLKLQEIKALYICTLTDVFYSGKDSWNCRFWWNLGFVWEHTGSTWVGWWI